MDRISQLLAEILHQIPSLLQNKTAAQTAVLSKLWLKACYTNPHLNFDQFDFYTSDDESDFDTSDDEADDEAEIEADFEPRHSDRFYESHVEFSRMVDSILERYRCENIPISDFNLRISFSDQTDCEGLVGKWLDIITETRASQVTLLVESKTEDYSERYTLLADSIFAMESLQQLELNHCKILKRKTLLSDDKIRISIKYDTIMDTEQLMNLQRSLVELCDQVVDLTLPSINKDFKLASEIDHLPPPEVENLSSYCPNSAYSSYFDLLFSICFPKSLVIQYCDQDFGEFLLRQLLKEKERRWRFIECTWKEYLMNAEIEYKKRTRNDWMTLDRKMLAADSRIFDEINTMCFKQTQRKEKNKYSCISR
ncbi:hypothetical protein KY285_007278 [Solanum tuberosum]|nr:hypothetical protein KY285_007278 [Solanum tuberosum]